MHINQIAFVIAAFAGAAFAGPTPKDPAALAVRDDIIPFCPP